MVLPDNIEVKEDSEKTFWKNAILKARCSKCLR